MRVGVYSDFIEIDAGHDFKSAWADINRAYRNLRLGGVIFGHDYFKEVDNRGVRRAVNLFAQMCQHFVLKLLLNRSDDDEKKFRQEVRV